MTPLQTLMAHFDAQRRRSFVIPAPAPDGQALTLYFDPLTLLELAELGQHRAKGPQEVALQAVLLKAQTADGKQAFAGEDGYVLKRLVDGKLIMAMSDAIFDTGPSGAALGERLGGRNAQASAPPSNLPASPESPLSSPSNACPSPSGADGLSPAT